MEKKKIDVTVIVPVYNVEKYINSCLDSLVSQHYDSDRYEIMIINDCSTDKSMKIINEYKSKYKNITICDLKKNMGVSNARNIGIQKSHGEYIMFCDSDDYYDLEAIKILMSAARENKSDYVMANYIIKKNNSEIKVDSTSYFVNKHISKNEIISYMNLTSCSKLISRELFIKNKILYPTDLKRCEELTVIPVLAYLANNPVVINAYLYYYIQRTTSASNKKIESIADLSFFDLSFKRFENIINCDLYSEELEFRAIEHLLYGKCLVLLKSTVKKEEVVSFINTFIKKYPKFTKNKYFKKFSVMKKIFVYSLKYKFVIVAKILAKVHEKITG